MDGSCWRNVQSNKRSILVSPGVWSSCAVNWSIRRKTTDFLRFIWVRIDDFTSDDDDEFDFSVCLNGHLLVTCLLLRCGHATVEICNFYRMGNILACTCSQQTNGTGRKKWRTYGSTLDVLLLQKIKHHLFHIEYIPIRLHSCMQFRIEEENALSFVYQNWLQWRLATTPINEAESFKNHATPSKCVHPLDIQNTVCWFNQNFSSFKTIAHVYFSFDRPLFDRILQTFAIRKCNIV